MKCINLIGERFGRLVVQTSVGKNPNGRYLWLCLCDCGNFWTVLGHNLRTGHTQSCGCLNNELVLKRITTHGHRKHGLTTFVYRCWAHMMQRCYNPNNSQYNNYGGRGIKVCERWLHSFENFYEDMGNCPTGMTLDRKDNDGDYEPENCRWATWEEQENNRRNNHWVEYRGERKTIAQWERYLGVNKGTIRSRLHRGCSIERSLATLEEAQNVIARTSML